MRVVYAASLLFLSISSCIFAWKVRKEGGLTAYIRRFILCSVVAMCACVVSSYSQVETLSLISFGIYYSAKIWLLVFFVRFILAYTDNHSGIVNVLMIVLALFVTVNLALNVKYQHGFSVKELNWVTDGNRYLILVPGTLYAVCLGTGFAMLAACVIVLIVKTVETPPAYRLRYLVFLFMISVMIALDSAFLIFNIPMDWGSLFYAVFAIVAWFFSIRFIRSYLLTGTLSVIVDHLDTGLVIFDYTDKPVYINERGERMLDTGMSGVTDLMEKWYGTRSTRNLKPGTREIRFERQGAQYVVTVQFEQLLDPSGNYNGSFFAVRDITAEKEKEQQEKYNREHDHLTNLYLQEPFYENCDRILRENPQKQYIMIRTETDVFDSIRSIYGKDTRDAVVAGIGGIIRKKCHTGGVGGWLKDESFSLLLPVFDFTEKAMVEEIEETLTEILGENVRSFRVQVGICPSDELLPRARALAEQAKAALTYIADDECKVVSWYTEGMRQKGIFDSNLTDSFANAVENGELRMYLQPILGPGNKGVVGAEAMIRWHRDGKVLLPEEFLPLLEKNKLIASADSFIWEQAVMQLAKWKAEKKRLFMTVNIARKDIYLHDICREFSGLLKKYAVDPSLLHVDISSDLMALEKNYLAGIIRNLKEEGIHINLEDFGGYYTAPIFLKDIPFDGIKLSRELVRGVESDAAGKALAKSIVDMGRNMGVSVYAEGIETEREFKAFTAMGCAGYMGFFVSEPVPAEVFEQSGLFR